MAIQHSQVNSVLIIGLGQTGVACARFLVRQGFVVAVMDTREQPPGLAQLQAELPAVVVSVGGLNSEWLLQSQTIVLSPGVDPRLPEIQAARHANIEIIGDIELFARYANAPIIAITGSNGKSTVTTLIAEMAVTSGKRIEVGGNLGTPALDLIVETAPDFYILELSSFQLETVSSLNAYASVVLNLSPDHLDRYDSEQDYQNAKAVIYKGNGIKIVNRDDPVVNAWAHAFSHQIGFTLDHPNDNDLGVMDVDGQQWLAYGDQTLLALNELPLSGKHNVANVLAALALGIAMDLPMASMLEAIKNYRGLPHRCELVAEHNGSRWIDDSKATNVGACIAAIEGLADSGAIILIAGGIAKDQDFSALSPVLAKHVRAIILLGQDADVIAKVVPSTVVKYFASDMDDVVKQAKDLVNEGDIVLLSPACASFDMFTGYAQRGQKFAEAVKDMLA